MILETGTIPRVDSFSFTAAGRPWIDYYWAFQATVASLERIGGLPLVSIVWILAYALIPSCSTDGWCAAARASSAIFLVLPLTHLVLLSHAYARPHVVTYSSSSSCSGGSTT